VSNAYRNRTIPLVSLMAVISMFAQSQAPSPNRPWHSPDELQIESEGNRSRQSAFLIESDKTYSLAELIDLAEAHNPGTHVAWENAIAQGAALGIARSELYPPWLCLASTARTFPSTAGSIVKPSPRFRRRSISTIRSSISAPDAAEWMRRARRFWPRSSQDKAQTIPQHRWAENSLPNPKSS